MFKNKRFQQDIKLETKKAKQSFAIREQHYKKARELSMRVEHKVGFSKKRIQL